MPSGQRPFGTMHDYSDSRVLFMLSVNVSLPDITEQWDRPNLGALGNSNLLCRGVLRRCQTFRFQFLRMLEASRSGQLPLGTGEDLFHLAGEDLQHQQSGEVRFWTYDAQLDRSPTTSCQTAHCPSCEQESTACGILSTGHDSSCCAMSHGFKLHKSSVFLLQFCLRQ